MGKYRRSYAHVTSVQRLAAGMERFAPAIFPFNPTGVKQPAPDAWAAAAAQVGVHHAALARYQRCCSRYLPPRRTPDVRLVDLERTWDSLRLTEAGHRARDGAARCGESVRRPERDARCRRPISEGPGRGAARCIDSNADRMNPDTPSRDPLLLESETRPDGTGPRCRVRS
jgi:hypothetical protein